jgi:hypothetical protein
MGDPMIELERTSRKLFPVKLTITRLCDTGPEIWHLIERQQYRSEGKLRYYRSVMCGSKYERSKNDDAAHDAIILNSPAEVIAVLSSTKLGNGRLCKTCRDFLQDYADNHPDMRGAPAMAIIVDRTKPLIILADGEVRQAEQKTVQAAKDLAKQITAADGIEATVMVPRTTFRRRAQPVEEIGHKPR